MRTRFSLFPLLFSAAVALIQFTTLVTAPLAKPQMTTSVYHNTSYSLRDNLLGIEIYGWYWIDWGPGYYDADFKIAKDMLMDGVFLVSDRYTFASHPEVFVEDIDIASRNGLEVGVVIFHPYDYDFQAAWGLPANQGVFADFTNKTWIEEVYTVRLRNSVAIGSSMGVSWYIYDDMTFDKVADLTNAQLFVDVTYSITNNKTIMLSHYPPFGSISNFLNLSVMHWDWYTAPEDIAAIEDSLTKRPLNNTSIGQFIWLYYRSGISFVDLQSIYEVLSNANRIEIFTLRIGDQSWTDAVTNSILENPTLVEYLTLLNRRIKHRGIGPQPGDREGRPRYIVRIAFRKD